MYVCMYVRYVFRTQSSPPNLSPLLRISSDDDRFVSAWMQRQHQRRNQKAPPVPPGQLNMSYIVDMRLTSADQQDDEEDDDGDDDGDGDGVDDPRDRSWNSIGLQRKQFICPATVPEEGDELDGDHRDDNLVHYTYIHTFIHT